MAEKKKIAFGRQIRGVTDNPDFDIDQWPSIDEGALSPEKAKEFLCRKEAILRYFEGAQDETLKQLAGIGRKQIYRLIRERCNQTHPDGRLYGWRGLIKHTRVNSYTRKKPIKVDNWGYGASGALHLLFSQHPDVATKFEKRILKSASEVKLSEIRVPVQSHWKWLTDELRRLGLETTNSWPFNTSTLGYSSIRKYILKVFEQNPVKAARASIGVDAAKKMKAGDGTGRPVLTPFKRVEMDSHKLDGRFCIMIPQVTGGWSPKIIYRIWVVVIIEIISRAVLGYHLSFGREVNKQDVLSAVKRALTKWEPRPLTFSDVAYREGAGLPSGYDERFVGACWDECSVDGALANTCRSVEEKFEHVLKAKILSPENSYAERHSKDDRPFIETFFRKLGRGTFQRMNNTTGGKTSDINGERPDKVALNSQFQLEYAEELLDVTIANYNGHGHTSLGHRSPLEYLDFCVSNDRMRIRYADPHAIGSLLSYRKLVPVHGGFSSSRLPYVHFAGANYSSDWLKDRQDLVGEKLWATNFIEWDARVAKLSLQNGIELGIVQAQPPWHLTPHSLKVRKAINSLANKKLIDISSSSDPVLELIDYSERQRDKKLPVHPAYLEIRDILSKNPGSILYVPPKEKTTEAESEPSQNTVQKERLAKSNKNPTSKENSSVLPARRKAVQR